MLPSLTIVLFWLIKGILMLWLLYRYRINHKSSPQGSIEPTFILSHPKVCVQLPLFNEPGQIVPLLESISHLSWPHSHLEVQVLDDSSDSLCQQEVDRAFSQFSETHPSIQWKLIRRIHREGYKAGALKEGMNSSQAQFFAVFDCDFRPKPDFLERTLPILIRSPEYGAVQAGWSFCNEHQNALTRSQAIFLGLHFHLEHAKKHALGKILNFNGTAGVWRRQSIELAGGWTSQTVTEDLHLSILLGLKSERIYYMEDLQVECLLPDQFSSFLIQQRRWAKGHGQVLKLVFKQVIRSQTLSFSQKVDIIAHLVAYPLSFSFLFLLAALPLWLRERSAWMSSSHYSDFYRILDALIWCLFLSLWLSLFASPKLHRKQNTFVIRWWRAIEAWSVGSLTNLFISPWFFVGLLSDTRMEAINIFHRTPKDKKAKPLNWKEVCLVLLQITFLASVAIYAMHLGLYFSSITLIYVVLMGGQILFPNSISHHALNSANSAHHKVTTKDPKSFA